MKTTILLFAVMLGYLTPIYSQLNRHVESDVKIEQFQKKGDDFGTYKFDTFGNYKSDKFSDFLSKRDHDSFNIPSTRPAPCKSTEEIYSGDNMPCFHPKSGDNMPCFKPTGTFHMRVFKPKNVIWGILW